jgi:hypothetical protein
MKRSRLIIGISLIALAVGGAGIYYGARSQYFGKHLGSHIFFVVLAIGFLSLLFLASEWYNSKSRD